VIKSVDAGRTWTSASTGLPLARKADSSYCTSTSVVIDPTDKSLYVAMYGDGVYKSTDRGATWTRKSAGLAVGNNTHVFQLKRHADGTLFCLITARRAPIQGNSNNYPDRGGLFKSTDKAETWTNISAGLLWWPVKFDVHPTDRRIIYIAAMPSTHGPEGGAYRTVDGGAHWERLALPATDPYAFAPVIDPANPSTVYVVTEGWGIFVSDNGGDTFREFTGIPFWGARHITFDRNGQRMYVSTGGGGVFKCQLTSTPIAVTSGNRPRSPALHVRTVGGRLTIDGLGPHAVVQIFRGSGGLVDELRAGPEGGTVEWNARSNNRAHSGMYFYRVLSDGRKECGVLTAPNR
jgi:photosystem II stability/assembly factor-like uncharacterized protein